MGQQKIDRYELKQVLGTGSFATVWLAHDPVVGIDVALKVLADNWARDPQMRERFISEGRTCLEASSTRMIRVHIVNETADGLPYIVMSYADGGTLGARITERRNAGKTHTIEETLAIGTELAKSVADVHANGLLHRDLKPENVLFATTPRGEQMLLGDFGLARGVENTAFTLISGSPGYVAPEQAAGLTQLTQKADLYPIGLILLELMTGVLPPGSTNIHEVASQAPIDVAAHLADRGVSTPPALVTLIQQLVAKSPDDRPTSADVVAAELARISPADAIATAPAMAPEHMDQATVVGGLPEITVEPVSPTRSSRTPIFALLGLVAAGVIAAGIIWGLGGSPTEEATTSTTVATADSTAAVSTTVKVVVATTDPNADAPTTTESTTTTTVAQASIVLADTPDAVLPGNVPLPPNTIMNRSRSTVGQRLEANVALTVEEVVTFYADQEEWSIAGRENEGDVVTLLVEFEELSALVTVSPTAVTSGSDTSNIVLEPATALGE